MDAQEKNTYRYYAFISYSRKDENWARWLQKKLETYRIPSMLRKENLNIPPKLHPVFRDKTDLTGGKLLDTLHEELDQSQYLIVICSPNSAASPWVDKEIRHFVEQGRDACIIPFIVDGEPMSDDPARECYPESLRTERESEILGISVKELGRRMAFLRVVASLLHLKFDQIVMRDRRRRMKQRIAAGAACLCLMIGLLAGIWYYMPHSAYYDDFVYRYEVPQGLHPLTREERMRRNKHVRIITRMGKVVRAEILNSEGKPINVQSSMGVSFSSINFFYGNEQLSRAEVRNALNTLILVEAYSSNLKAVDFQKSNDSSQAFALSSGENGFGMGTSGMRKSEITRHINSYDENGFLIETRFMRDSRNTPVADTNGSYGLRYERNSEGRVKSMTCLDENGNPHNCRYGYAAYIYTYDENGQCTSLESFNANGEKVKNESGFCRKEFILDKFGNLLSEKYFDEQHNLCNCKDGYAQTEYRCTSQGFLEETRLLDTDGNPAASKADGVHARRYSYNADGFIVREECFDTEMQPVYNYSGYCRIDYGDGQEGPFGEYYYGTDGTPVCEKESGAYGKLNQWSDGVDRTTYVDAKRNPMMSRYGYAILEELYDSDGNVIKRAYFDDNGNLIRNKDNYASVEFEYDGVGKQIRTVFKDELGKQCVKTGGYGEFTYSYDERGNMVSEKYYDDTGTPVVISDGYHEIRRDFDDHGNMSRIEYRNVDGNLITDYKTDRYAAAEYRYDEYGNELECFYYDADGFPEVVVRAGRGRTHISAEYDARGNMTRMEERTSSNDGDEFFGRIVVYGYDDRDNQISYSLFHIDGQPYPDENGSAVYVVDYDKQNRKICYGYFDGDGNQQEIIKFMYNERHQLTKELYFFPDTDSESMELAYQYWSFYDAAGNPERVEFRDADGNLKINNLGYAIRERRYNMTGDAIEEVFYDENGDLCLSSNNYALLKIEYDALGNRSREMYYDQNKTLFAVNEFSYNNQGWMLSAAYLDGSGNLRSMKDYPSRVEYEYTASGSVISRTCYDSEGNDNVLTTSLVLIGEVADGGQAALAGIQTGDLLLKWDDWELFRYADINKMDSALTEILQKTRDTEKIVVIGRENKERTEVEFYAIPFEPGSIGVTIVDDPRSLKRIEYIFTQYEAWKEQNQ